MKILNNTKDLSCNSVRFRDKSKNVCLYNRTAPAKMIVTQFWLQIFNLLQGNIKIIYGPFSTSMLTPETYPISPSSVDFV